MFGCQFLLISKIDKCFYTFQSHKLDQNILTVAHNAEFMPSNLVGPDGNFIKTWESIDIIIFINPSICMDAFYPPGPSCGNLVGLS